MLGEFLFAFVAGAIAMANPCGFALLPAYLARRLGAGDADSGSGFDGIILAIGVGAATTIGFLLVFGLVGTVVSLGAYWLIKVMPWAGLVIGVILFIIGVAILFGRRVSVRIPAIGMVGHGGWRGDVLFGVGFGTTSLSCALPIFLMVMGAATTGGPAASALSFIAYALGMGSILTALAVAATLARHGLAARIKGLAPHLSRLSGIFLLLAGAYVTYYWGTALFMTDPSAGNSIIETGLIWSGVLQTWLDSSSGETFVVGLFLALAALFLWAVVRRSLARRTGPHCLARGKK